MSRIFVSPGKSVTCKGFGILDEGTEIENKHGFQKERIQDLVKKEVFTTAVPKKLATQEVEMRAAKGGADDKKSAAQSGKGGATKTADNADAAQ